MKKNYAGYINLKPLNGIIYPSFIQNIILKDYVQNKLQSSFYLSPTEILQAKHSVTLSTLASDETKLNGIVMLSTFFLPQKKNERIEILNQCLKLKKQLHFILDEIIVTKKIDLKLVEEYMIFSSLFFTKTKTKLNKFEKDLIKPYKNISFV